jgi:uncharacterized membrane protein YoaK (UPF0700 family)
MHALVLRDGLLMALTFGSGATDAICYLALGKVFTAFMTGNLVFLGLALAGVSGPSVLSILVPLLMFGLGVFGTALIVSPTRGAGVWPRRVTAALALSLIGRLCFMSIWVAVGGQPSRAVADVLLGVSGLAMGVQTAAVFSLGIQGVFTTAVTATWTILSGEAVHWAENRSHRRLHVGMLSSLVVGAFCGGVVLDHARRQAPLVPLAASVLVVVLAVVCRRRLATCR